MPHPLVSTLVIFMLLLFGLLLFALRSCESPSNEPIGPAQYDNAREDTTAPTEPQGIQYSSESLPPTGGVRLW